MVICDSSPLIHLAGIGRLGLLRAGLYDLNKTGAIGVLIRSRLEGKLEALRPELDKIRNESGFWIEERLYLKALAAVGEEPGTS